MDSGERRSARGYSCRLVTRRQRGFGRVRAEAMIDGRLVFRAPRSAFASAVSLSADYRVVLAQRIPMAGELTAGAHFARAERASGALLLRRALSLPPTPARLSRSPLPTSRASPRETPANVSHHLATCCAKFHNSAPHPCADALIGWCA